MTNIKSKAGIENQDKKLRIEIPKAPDEKADKYLIGIIRKGLHDHYIDVEFITRKCLEEGLVKIIDEPNTIEATDKGKKFVKQYDSIILNEADFKIYNSVEALLMRHTYIFLMEGLNCPCCVDKLDQHSDKWKSVHK
mgnify:CR=1 FL=1